LIRTLPSAGNEKLSVTLAHSPSGWL
jgi:hypothetical protein